MAITAVDYQFFTYLKEKGAIPPKPAILELGESNWYGDVQLKELLNDIVRLVPDENEQKALMERLRTIVSENKSTAAFDIVKLFYRIFLDYSHYEAIDYHGTEKAKRLDLNLPVDMGRQYDMVINIGTAEHVFNVMQFFKTVHDLTVPGGLMIHEMPFNGWVDHGFYNFQPTFYFDLAAANGYTIELMLCGILTPFKAIQVTSRDAIADWIKSNKVPSECMLSAALRKPEKPADFKIPMQGYYFSNVSEDTKNIWARQH